MKRKRIISLLLVLVVSLSLFTKLPTRVHASSATVDANTIKTIADLENAINASMMLMSGAGDVITVNGIYTGTKEKTLNIVIKKDVKVVWKATYNHSEKFDTVVISGNGTFEVAGGSLINMSGTGDTIVHKGGNLIVSGGIVTNKTPSKSAIYSTAGTVTISGGMVGAEGVGGFGICITSSAKMVVVNGGSVYSSGSGGRGIWVGCPTATLSKGEISASGDNSIGILATNASTTININNGTLSAGTNGNCILSNGDKTMIFINNGTLKTKGKSFAISTNGANSKVLMTGGTLNAAWGGIKNEGSSSSIVVTGGKIFAGDGTALMNTTSSASIEVAGNAMIFATGTAVSGTATSKIAICNLGSNLSISGQAVVIALNKTKTEYTVSTSTDISVNTQARAVWDISSGKHGISYSNGTNKGFIQISGVTCKAPHIPTTTQYALKVNNGSGSGNYDKGVTITIKADAAPSGKVFDKWTATGITLAKPGNAQITITMPANDVTLTANYKDKPTSTTPSTPKKYKALVNGGSGGGDYEGGATVSIKADPAPVGKVFDKWTSSGVSLNSPEVAETSFTMPNKEVTLTATYKDAEKPKDDPNKDKDKVDDKKPNDNAPDNGGNWLWYLLVILLAGGLGGGLAVVFAKKGKKDTATKPVEKKVEVEKTEVKKEEKPIESKAEEANAEHMFCSKCGKELALGSKFCSKCGTEVID